ncbi:MAG: hypothetical protein ACUVT3_06080 [Ignavibacterium sp.]|uniref:hypothetical protein n=1 Tax=Ignavibacterium sp. TaxID=2651167 RepID=UPI00404B887A
MIKLFLIISLVILSGCREEILEPYNPAGNINQPYQEKKLNYFNLVMTASNLTYEIDSDLNFNSSDSRILVSVIDRQSGTVTINVLNDSKNLIYVASIETEVPDLVDRIQGNIPNKVKIIFKDFSGKVRIQLSKNAS